MFISLKPSVDRGGIRVNLVLMGLPGAGKGTQAEQIVDKYEHSSYLYRRYVPFSD